MKAIEVWRNGRKIFTAGVEEGGVTAKLIIRNQVDPTWFDVDGRDRNAGHNVRWSHLAVEVGDEFFLRLVDVDPEAISRT